MNAFASLREHYKKEGKGLNPEHNFFAVMELVGPSKRKIASVISGIFFSFGQVVLGCLAYFIRDYRYLQLAISLPALVFLCYWW